MAVSAMGYRAGVEKHCPALGYRVDSKAWDELFLKLGAESVGPGSPRANQQAIDVSLAAEAASFEQHPKGGCMSAITWSRYWFPEMAARLISPPKAY
ncbi:hypothetical protein [Enterovirga sp. CN4-39]|uniref:hypothetical protein n=1 Tax=Enterovirga sp. CN4-39 TaxID=3400910 RepID=UPI003C1079DD